MKTDKATILLVDDEPDILEIIGFNLSNEGYKVHTSNNGKKGLEKAKKLMPDLIISDIMMPIMDGIEMCEHIRKDPSLVKTMLVFLTARGEDYSHMAGFDVGADDYITKPIKPKVLVSKIKSLLRRVGQVKDTTKHSQQLDEGRRKVKIKDLIIDNEAYKVVKSGKEMVLPRKEFELLSLLTSRTDKVFKREEILSIVWGSDIVVGGRTIDVHIRKLRKKIGSKHIVTIKGVGYKYLP